MTGWRVTQEGCDDIATMRVVATCCASPQAVNKTTVEAFNNPSVAAVEAGGMDEDARREAIHDFAAAESHNMPGPLIDALVIQEGASFMPRDVAHKSMSEAFDFIQSPDNTEGGSTDDESLSTSDERATMSYRFCEHHLDSAGDMSRALAPCPRTGRSAGSVKPVNGNVFLKTEIVINTHFAGEWKLRVRSHGFRGSVSITRTGRAEPVSGEQALTKSSTKVGVIEKQFTVCIV